MSLLEIAKKAANAIEKKATGMGLSATICVLDTNGHVTFMARMPGASLLSVRMAQAKAYTSALFGMATADLMPLVQPGQPLYGLTSALSGEIVAFGGGVAVKDGPNLVGGLGVSAGTIEQDIELANAGIEAVAK
jgi:uncharacterized protein GlcG (DUF336 family)